MEILLLILVGIILAIDEKYFGDENSSENDDE